MCYTKKITCLCEGNNVSICMALNSVILQFYICWCQTFARLLRCCYLSSYTREIESGELWDLIKSYVPRLVLLFLEPRLINHLAVAASYNLQKLLDYFNVPYYKRKTYFLIHPHYILFLMEMSNAFLLKLTDLTIMKFVVRIHI